jgi:hypothetical protein
MLIDNGRTPSPEKLVAEMDRHIEGMADLLGQPVPNEEFPWVRCSLFGIKSVTIPPWAMCCQDDNPDNLTYLDRHEVAHALMMQLSGPDYDPPSLLAEGWAESQSSDRNHQIRTLAEKHKQRRTYSLQELVSPTVYGLGGSDSPPAYWEGGPLAHYLMQRYGSATFFRLCSGARRNSFREDCQAILGDSWETVEVNFWKWIDAEGESLYQADAKHPDTTSETLVELAPSVNPADWQALVEGYRKSNKDSEWLPSKAAFVLEGNKVERDVGIHESSKHTIFEFRAIFAGEQFWIFDNLFRIGGDSFLMATPGCSADLQRNDAGSFRGRRTPAWPRDGAFDILAFYQSEADPANLLPLRENPQIGSTCHVERLDRPIQGKTSLWNVRFTRRGAKDESEMRCQIELDPQQQWRTTRVVREGKRGWRFEADMENKYLGDALMPVVQHIRFVDKEREVTVDSQARLMSDIERQELKQRVEQAAQSEPAGPYPWLRCFLLAIVIICPLGGITLLSITPLTIFGTGTD